MGVFGPGVGGGFLAAAGAVGGVGKGLAEVGEAQTKENLATKMNGLQQAREEAITRLQGQQQSGLEEQRAGHEKERVGEEIAGRSAVAHYEVGEKEAEAEKGRTQATSENAKKQASQEKIAHGHDVARVSAVQARVPAGKNPPKEWTPRTLNLQGTVINGQIVPGRGVNVMTHRDGSSWVQVGDKLLPYDGSASDGLGVKPESLARAPAGAIQALVTNPLGSTPSGMPLKDSFANRYHYLPLQYMNAAQQARDAATKPSGGGGGGGEDSGGVEQPDPAESEPNPTAPE